MSAVQTVLLYAFLRDTGLFFSLILKMSLSFSLHIRSQGLFPSPSGPYYFIFTIESEQEQSEPRTVCTKRQTQSVPLS